jgi:hypothetical protein
VEPNTHVHGPNPVRIWQSDYNKEQASEAVEEWIASKSSKLRFSPPYKHSKNGQIERDMQTTLDKARIVMAAYNCPVSWWYFAVKYSVYTLNRCSTTKVDIRTPFERLTGNKPIVSHLVPFFCPGFYQVTKEEIGGSRSNWQAKAKPCRMIGYDDYVEEGYILYDIDSMQEIYGRQDVIFDATLVQQCVQSVNDLTLYRPDEDANEERVGTDSTFFNPIDVSYVVETRGCNFQEKVINGAHAYYIDYELPISDSYGQDEIDELVHHVASANLIDNSLALPIPPKTIAEALDPNHPLADIWEDAIIKELQQFDEYNIFQRGQEQYIILEAL